VGFRLDVRGLDDLPRGSARAVGFATGLPFLLVVAAAAALLMLGNWSAVSLSDPGFLRDALVLGTAGAMTAQQASRLIGSSGTAKNLFRLEELAGIVGLAFIAAYFRPQGDAVGWQLPGTAWLFLTVGLGGIIGVLAYVVLRRPASQAESVLLLLGTVAFAAGFASNLFLSPGVGCFVAGVLRANMPSDTKDQLRDALRTLERPIYLLFLVIVGAIWDFGDWRGWLLLPFFVGMRLVGKWGADVLVQKTTEVEVGQEHWTVRRAPIGQLSIAIVVSAQLLFPHGAIPILETAVLGGAILTELLVQILARGRQKPAPEGRQLELGVGP
jgi:Kef-type K+ transport system membrane component KefB